MKSAGLTKRQSEILGMMAEGICHKTISRRLGISISTIRVHLRFAYERLGALNGKNAVAIALRKHYIE